MFSRSYALLSLTRFKVGESTTFIFRNASKSCKLSACFSVDKPEDKISNDDIKEDCLSKNNAPDNTGYSERLKNDAFMKGNENTESNNCVTKIHNEGEKSYSVQLLERKWYMLNDGLMDVEVKLPGPFDRCEEDLSHVGPNITPTYNFAKFANQSNTIQQLVKLGVELYKLEANRDVVEMFLRLDFDKDMKPYIQFLHDCGVNSDNLGLFITRNPMIFKESMDDLYTRIRYLRAHKFNTTMIQLIMNRHPPWLSFKIEEIDSRLGYFQNTFKLNSSSIRNLATKCPKLIAYDMNRIRRTTFSVKEEMGFKLYETKAILLTTPRVWIRAGSEVVKTFDYLHNYMKISHTAICQEPQVLLCRRSRLERRHKFLVELKRDQYDRLKPLYVSPLNLVTGSDVEFCEKIAKADISTYNEFLKSF